MSLGFSHPIEYQCPGDVSIDTPSPTQIVVRGQDKQRVGQTAAEIRAYRPAGAVQGQGRTVQQRGCGEKGSEEEAEAIGRGSACRER